MQTVRSIELGVALRQLREATSLKDVEGACKRLGWHPRKLARHEAGLTIPKLGDLLALLDIYNASEPKRGELKSLRREALDGRRGWWRGFANVFNGPLPDLEANARTIRCFATNLVPGLAQTADYARALITAARPEDSPDSVDTRVRARLARQAAVFERTDPPLVHLIIDEIALLRPVGGQAVLDAQVSALRTLSQRPNVTVQIIPLKTGAHAGMEGGFMLLDFPSGAFSQAAHTAGQAGDVYLEGEKDLERLDHLWGRLTASALPPSDSANKLAELSRR